MEWRNWKNHPFIFTLVGALLLGYLVRKCTEPAPYRYDNSASAPAQATPAPAPAQVVASPAVSTTPSQYQVAQLPPKPAAAASVAFSAPTDRPVISSPSYSSGRRGYTTYTFTLDDVAYLLDGQASFDHLCEMKRQANVHDADITRLRAVCQALSAEIDGNQSQLAFMRSTLDRSDEFAVNRFNAEVRRSNQVVEQYRTRQAELNGYVDRHNAIVQAMHVYASQHRR